MSQTQRAKLIQLQDAGNGAVFMPLPSELLQKLRIREGDKIILTECDDGTLLLAPLAPLHRRILRMARTVAMGAARLFR